MDEKLKNLFEKNKIVFFLLLPLVLLIIFKDALFSLLVASSRKIFNDAKQKDEKLQKEEVELTAQADKLKAESDQIEKSIGKGSVDEDWNKTYKD